MTVNIDSMRAYARRLQLEPHGSTCLIERPSGASASNPADVDDDRGIDHTWTPTYDDICKIRPPGDAADVDAAGASVTVDTVTLDLLWDADVESDDRATVSSTSDPRIHGRTGRVEEVARGDGMTAVAIEVRFETPEVDA